MALKYRFTENLQVEWTCNGVKKKILRTIKVIFSISTENSEANEQSTHENSKQNNG